MSGGAFDYKQYQIRQIKEDIESIIERQGKQKHKDELWEDDEYYKKYPEEKFNYIYPEHIVIEFKKGIEYLRLAEIYANRIDYLLSGDDGEENFIKRLNQELIDSRAKKD
jgi:hypothetical protein